MNPNASVVKRPRRARSLARAAYYVFLAGGVFGLAYAGYVVADSDTYQAAEQSKFENISHVKARPPTMKGSTLGEMEVPRLGLKVAFVQGDSPGILRHAVGHMPETALPGESGNVVLTGHRDTFFRPLRNIDMGDAITLKTFDGDFRYQVESTAVVPANDIQVLQPSSAQMLTLITCFPFYYVGPAPKRFVVRARRIDPLPAHSSIDGEPLRF
jgi:sortase A